MKRAYWYIRKSTEEQSHFSTSGQRMAIEEFARRLGIELIGEPFIDDESGKNFDRTAWKKLEKIMSRNQEKGDYLIVWKYDRLIRNAIEGLTFIERLEQKWNIKLLSVLENFHLDPDDPLFFKLRAGLLVDAEYERKTIIARTKFGIWSARSQGRFIGRAPIGYLNSQDQDKKPILLIDQEKSKIIIQMFYDFVSGMTIQHILERAKEKGFRQNGHDITKRILGNPVYAGLVEVPAYRGSAKKLTKGIHEPIISEEIFWAAQSRLNMVQGPTPKILRDDMHLRGVLYCQQCGQLHTASKTKGRNAYYWYYFCKDCRKPSYAIKAVHDQFTQMMQSLSLPPDSLERLKEMAMEEMNLRLSQDNKTRNRLANEKKSTDQKLSSLEEKYIENKINHATYAKWKAKYSSESVSLSDQLQEHDGDNAELWSLFNEQLPRLADMSFLYDKADIKDKHDLVRCLFPTGLMKTSNGFQTATIHPLFQHKAEQVNYLEVKMQRPEIVGSISSRLYPQADSNRTALVRLLTVISRIAA